MSLDYPDALTELIRQLARLPGVGQRSAERLALALLDWEEDRLRTLAEHIGALRQRIHPCVVCGNLADGDRCRVCADPRRDQGLLCVVEHSRQIPAIEKGGKFQGLYHVLGGRLAPLEQVEAEDLNLASLYARLTGDTVREVILATSPDIEGEATASYLAEELRGRFAGLVTRIALGVPVGSDLSYADSTTLGHAISSR